MNNNIAYIIFNCNEMLHICNISGDIRDAFNASLSILKVDIEDFYSINFKVDTDSLYYVTINYRASYGDNIMVTEVTNGEVCELWKKLYWRIVEIHRYREFFKKAPASNEESSMSQASTSNNEIKMPPIPVNIGDRLYNQSLQRYYQNNQDTYTHISNAERLVFYQEIKNIRSVAMSEMKKCDDRLSSLIVARDQLLDEMKRITKEWDTLLHIPQKGQPFDNDKATAYCIDYADKLQEYKKTAEEIDSWEFEKSKFVKNISNLDSFEHQLRQF